MALWSESLLEAQAQSALAAQLRLDAEAAFALASVEADAAHAAGLAAHARAVLEEQAAIAAQQLAQTYRSEQQQAAAEAVVQSQLAAEAQAEADRYAALAADPPSTYAETLFAYDLAGHLIGEYRADGSVLREYVWLEDQPLALLRPTSGLLGGVEAFYYHVDQLNTPQQLMDATGQVVWAGIQQPFGEVEVTTAEVEQNLRFPGQQYDAETGLHYNYFRDYDPGVGRYRESDPIGLAGGPNAYIYVDGAPLSYSDAEGLLAQGIVDFSAGMGDVILLGQGPRLRELLGVSGGVNQCSAEYDAGEWAGIAASIATGVAGGLKAAGAKSAGREFSHWIPRRMGGPRTTWNGNYVSPPRHYAHDPYRYPKGWRDMGPKWSPVRQQLDRVPNAYKGGATGAGYGATGATAGDCGCEP